jgi:hypothetical protein
MAFEVPQFLPDGSTLFYDSDFMARLHDGDATVGWAGDDRLAVYQADGCLEVRRMCEDSVLRTVCRSKPGVRTLNTDTLRFLAKHDGRGEGANVAERIIAQNDAVRAAQDAKFKEVCDDMADRLEFGLMRDIGATEGSGLTKRLYTVSDFRKDAK